MRDHPDDDLRGTGIESRAERVAALVGDSDQRSGFHSVGRNNVGAIDPDVTGFEARGAARGDFNFREVNGFRTRGHEDMVMPGGRVSNGCNAFSRQRALCRIESPRWQCGGWIMADQRLELQSILMRLERVELENRRLKRGVAVFLVLAGAALLMGQGRPNRTIEAEKFLLKDANGRVRARLDMEPADRPTLALLDARGFPLASLGAGETPSMTLSKNGGGQQVQIGSFSSDLFGVALYANDKETRFRGLQAAIGVFRGSPGIELYNDSGQAAGLDLDAGRPKLVLTDPSGASTTMISTSIFLLDKDQKLLWSAP